MSILTLIASFVGAALGGFLFLFWFERSVDVSGGRPRPKDETNGENACPRNSDEARFERERAEGKEEDQANLKD